MAKLNYEIEFHPEAIREIREAVQWYRERSDEVAASETMREFCARRLAETDQRTLQ